MTGLTASAKRPLLHVADQQAAGAAGGTFTSGAWRTRVLNTEVVNEISGASLSSNQITLPPGDYEIWASAPAQKVDTHKAKLYDTTGAADLIVGTSERAWTTDNIQTASFVVGRFSLSATSAIELQHRSTWTQSSDGMGYPANVGAAEVYSEVMIWKV